MPRIILEWKDLNAAFAIPKKRTEVQQAAGRSDLPQLGRSKCRIKTCRKSHDFHAGPGRSWEK